MCGRFANSETIPAIAVRWSAEITNGTEDWQPSDDIRPTNRVPVLLEGEGRPRRLGLMTWGWKRDFAQSGMLINARVEDAANKASFAEAMRKRRCLVPATAWFEWQAQDGKQRKMKHRLRPDGENTWALAALWETVLAADGARGAAIVILTTAAHQSVSHVHDRMPCILESERAHDWLTGASGGVGPWSVAAMATPEPLA